MLSARVQRSEREQCHSTLVQTVVYLLGLCYVECAVCGQTWDPTTAVNLSCTLTDNVHSLCAY